MTYTEIEVPYSNQDVFEPFWIRSNTPRVNGRFVTGSRNDYRGYHRTPEVEEWLSCNIVGDWDALLYAEGVSGRVFRFESARDATLFKLTWC